MTGWALQPPTSGEQAALRGSPDELQRRVEQAMRFGNHRVKPWLVQHTTAKLAALAKGEDPRKVPPPAWQGMPTSGTNQVLVFLIDFPDQPHVNSYAAITNKLFGAGLPAEFPLESLTAFYQRSSYGLLRIEGSALGWYTMAHPRDWYTDTYGSGNEANYAIIQEVADHFDGLCDYSQFDNNHDGNIDYFAVLWSGPDNGWANFWWGYQWSLQDVLTRDGVRFKDFSWQWESRPVGSAYYASVIIHETGHALGLPDYYDYKTGLGPEGGVGGMDMMDANYCDHNCFSKFMLDWLYPTVVSNALAAFPLRAAADYPEAVALARGYSGGSPYAEYFMVQNRQKVNNDKNLPGSGLAIWHIDARLDGTGDDFLYNNSYSSHKLLRLMESDGLEEIEDFGEADAGDLYAAGKEFTPESTPNSLAYDGASTEVRVTEISASAPTMTADYSALDNTAVLTPTPVRVREGSTTNIAVTMTLPLSTNATLSFAFASGDPDLYIAGESNFTFTASDWNVPQWLTIGALPDADETHGSAVFHVDATGGGAVGSQFVVREMDMGDMIPPVCSISASADAARTTLTIDFAFNEEVMGFDASDLSETDNIPGGATLTSFDDVSGTGTLFRAVYAISGSIGALTLNIPAGSLQDLGGNANPGITLTYTIPWRKADFHDDFDGLVTSWLRSTNVFAELTTDGWKWGVPVFSGLWSGPVAAHSGSNCWGTMDGPYGAIMDAWVQSPAIPVGGHPLLSFWLWQSGGPCFVEVNNGSGWVGVASYESGVPDWTEQRIPLDPALFGNRTLRVRFRARDCAMYVDDVTVTSDRPAGLWSTEIAPSNGPAGTAHAVMFTVYNSTTGAVASALGWVMTPDTGAAVTGGVPVVYGPVAAGAVVTGAAPVHLVLAASNVVPARVTLSHVTQIGTALGGPDGQMFTVDTAVAIPTNLFVARSVSGVTNWLGRYLAGNGGVTSCLLQVIYAGSNGVVNAPQAGGRAGGDDQVLYSADLRQPWGRFGEGAGVPPDAGRFIKPFAHALGAGAKVYVRAWNGPAFDTAVAYGDSGLFTLTAAPAQTNDFGTWRVGTPAPGSFQRDSNGDGVPDGWCVLAGLDPDQAAAPLGASVVAARAQTDFNKPNRVALSSKFVFVADTENNRVQVWDRALTNRLFVLGAATFSSEFSKPRGLAVNAAGDRLAVADTAFNRVRLFSVNTTNGSLTALFNFGSLGTGDGQFRGPIDVAFGADGRIWVADSQQSGSVYNNRIQVFTGAGVYESQFGAPGSGDGAFNRVLGLSVAADGTVYAADGENHRIQAFAGTTFSWAYGSYGAGAGQFNRVWDVHPGLSGLLYVADFYNNRIQVLNASAAPTVTVAGSYTNAGSILGAFNLPQCAVPAPDGQGLYVADTYNHRVLRLTVTLDADGDGMDDLWEMEHGLDPNDPSDANEDPDGDGVSSLGEFRVGTDPQDADTNGNGGGDGWDMATGLNPLATNAPAVNPPKALSMAASPSLARAGDVVRVTVIFSQAITNVPLLWLSGAVWAGPVTMSGGGTTWYGDFVMPAGASGAVNASQSGAIGISGYYTDPTTFTSNGVFTLADLELRIAEFGMPTTLLGWQALSGDIYRVQSCTNLILSNWVDGVSVTSEVSGLLTVTNAFPVVEPVQFMRVLRVAP